MVKFEAVVDSKGLVHDIVKGDDIEEVAKAIPDALSLFSRGLKAKPRISVEEATEVPKWIVDNVSDWEKNKERNQIIYAIFLMNNNRALMLDQIKDEVENLGVDLDDWLAHNFKRDMGGDVVEVAREGRKRSYKLSAVGLKKANALEAEFTKK